MQISTTAQNIIKPRSNENHTNPPGKTSIHKPKSLDQKFPKVTNTNTPIQTYKVQNLKNQTPNQQLTITRNKKTKAYQTPNKTRIKHQTTNRIPPSQETQI